MAENLFYRSLTDQKGIGEVVPFSRPPFMMYMELQLLTRRCLSRSKALPGSQHSIEIQVLLQAYPTCLSHHSLVEATFIPLLFIRDFILMCLSLESHSQDRASDLEFATLIPILSVPGCPSQFNSFQCYLEITFLRIQTPLASSLAIQHLPSNPLHPSQSITTTLSNLDPRQHEQSPIQVDSSSAPQTHTPLYIPHGRAKGLAHLLQVSLPLRIRVHRGIVRGKKGRRWKAEGSRREDTKIMAYNKQLVAMDKVKEMAQVKEQVINLAPNIKFLIIQLYTFGTK